jgi:hypothetical protein
MSGAGEGTQIPPPAIWGPHFWKTMDYVARAYGDSPSPQQRDAARQFFRALQYLLPCEKCCGHYRNMMTRRPLEQHLLNGDALRAWVAACKEEVSERVAGERGVSRVSYARRPNIIVHTASHPDQPLRAGGPLSSAYTPTNRRRAVSGSEAAAATAAPRPRGPFASRPAPAAENPGGGCGCGK